MAKGQPTMPEGMWPKYPKIQSLFKRYNSTEDRTRIGEWIPGEYSTREFQFLQSNHWMWTEKVDGTNVRVSFDSDHRILIGGKTDAAVMPPGLMEGVYKALKAYDGVYFDRERLSSFSESLSTIVIYGEGYGAGIQKVGSEYRADKSFIAYDIFVKTGAPDDIYEGYWLPRPISHAILRAADIPVVPGGYDLAPRTSQNICAMTLPGILQFMMRRTGEGVSDRSQVGNKDKLFVEGYVGVPEVPMFDARGGRIIVKLTYPDVARLALNWELDSDLSTPTMAVLFSRSNQADGTRANVILGI